MISNWTIFWLDFKTRFNQKNRTSSSIALCI
jgi:hypothetical protein